MPALGLWRPLAPSFSASELPGTFNTQVRHPARLRRLSLPQLPVGSAGRQGWCLTLQSASTVLGRLLVVSAARMLAARKKIVKEKGAEPDEFEETVAQVCHAIFHTSRP